MPEKTKCEVVVAIQSCQKFVSRRKTCKNTWLRHVPAGVEYFFGIGDASIDEESKDTWEWDTVAFKTDDGYVSLPEKTRLMLKYALANYDFKYLFKCDDDTYVVLERLLELLRSQEGNVFMSNVMWTGADATISGGAGYVLSKEYVELALEDFGQGDEKILEKKQEDMYVQYALKMRDILPVGTDLFKRVAHVKLPGKYNKIITAHALHEREMEAIEAGLYSPTAKHVLCMHYNDFIREPLPYMTFIPELQLYFLADASRNFGNYMYDGNSKKLKLFRDTEQGQIVLDYIGDGYWEEEKLGPFAIVTPITPDELEGKELQTE